MAMPEEGNSAAVNVQVSQTPVALISARGVKRVEALAEPHAVEWQAEDSTAEGTCRRLTPSAAYPLVCNR